MSTLERRRIGEAFAAASADYEAHADVQARIAERLAAFLPDSLAAEGQVLDAGCGTGRGFPHLRDRYPTAAHLGLDLAPAMAQKASTRGLPAAAADIEALPLADASVALYWSSLAWQWCDPELAACEAARTLTPGGALCIATLGPGTLAELRDAFGVLVDGASHVRAFHDSEVLHAALRDAGLRDIKIERELHYAHAPDLGALLQGIRGIGARTLGEDRRRGLLGRHGWQAVQARYETHRSELGLPACYEVFFVRASR